MYQLRPRQKVCSAAGVKSLNTPSNGITVTYASCGFGKSLVVADISSKLNAPTLVLQPTKELLIQNYEKMVTYNVPDVTMYSASVGKKELGNITFATIGSIKDVSLFKRFKYILIDEAHLVNPTASKSMYYSFLKEMGNPPSLGLTGTPFRTAQKYIKEKRIENGREVEDLFYTTTITPLTRFFNSKDEGRPFGRFNYKVEMEDIINDGHLCRPSYDLSYSKAFDYSKLKTNGIGSEFDQDALDHFVNQPDRLKNTVMACKEYDEKCTINLVFCSSIKQAKSLSEMAKKMDLKADFITSKDGAKDRKKKLDQFKQGEIKHLFNVGIAIRGLDIPWLNTVTNARPSLSVETWVQSGARCIRKDPNDPTKKATIVDVAGISKVFGRIETIKMGVEDGFKDCIISEVGTLSGKMISKFKMKKDESGAVSNT